jgi:DNA-binding NarL/FixJ family response regulator
LEAIEQAQRLRPQAVLLDLAMPQLDGLTALPRLRELLPNAAIICLSGMSTHNFESAALVGGADRYLEKGGSLLLLADALASAHASRV